MSFLDVDVTSFPNKEARSLVITHPFIPLPSREGKVCRSDLQIRQNYRIVGWDKQSVPANHYCRRNRIIVTIMRFFGTSPQDDEKKQPRKAAFCILNVIYITRLRVLLIFQAEVCRLLYRKHLMGQSTV